MTVSRSRVDALADDADRRAAFSGLTQVSDAALHYAQTADALRDLAAERDALVARLAEAERQRDQVEAIVDDLNFTAMLAHALEEDVIADNWAWIFEDALAQQNEALARIKETRDEAI